MKLYDEKKDKSGTHLSLNYFTEFKKSNKAELTVRDVLDASGHAFNRPFPFLSRTRNKNLPSEKRNFQRSTLRTISGANFQMACMSETDF